MTRRTRRRLHVVGTVALLGSGAPLWAPPLLSRMEAFRVSEVRVTGAHYVASDRILRRAGIDPEASVWDDPRPWEEAVASHPLVVSAEVRRIGMRRLEIRVREAEPVALVPTPELVAVDRQGRVLPLDPMEARLDLPILGVRGTTEEGRLSDVGSRRLLRCLVALREGAPDFAGRVSQLLELEEGGVSIHLTDARVAERVLLPVEEPLAALRRVEAALGRVTGREVAAVTVADARFEGQVVLVPVRRDR